MTVCRMNQARSALGEALIRRDFPEVDVISAGVFAQDGTPYLPEVVAVARKWGISIEQGFSNSFKNNQALLESDFVICAEESMLPLISQHGYRGKLVSYEEIVPDPSFMPVDPAGLRGRFLETELAKVVFINHWAVRTVAGNKSEYEVLALIPENELNTRAAIETALFVHESSGALIVDADLRAPLFREFGEKDLRVGNLTDFQNHQNYDLLSCFIDQEGPEAKFFEKEWKEMIATVANSRPIVFVTAPQIIESGPLPDSYLASLRATRIEVIRRK
jgi:protein-tyrosine-phosphatase